jgi:glycosyltransferase involved in cell wall biosynthesis
VRPPISVLTPVHRPVAGFLDELHASLHAQRDVDWEWVIQIDGGRSLVRRLPQSIRDDGRVAVEANGRWFGEAVTRNLALLRARHALIQTVDADDLLLPGALRTAAAALEAEPDLALAFGRTVELTATGRRVPGKNLYPPGRLSPGVLARDWEQRNGSCSIVVASAMWRADCIHANGGWPASVTATDVLLLLAISGVHPARCLERETYVYRSHPQQMHRSAVRFAMRPKYREMARGMMAARQARARTDMSPRHDSGPGPLLLAGDRGRGPHPKP